jgi:hypothetical protein
MHSFSDYSRDCYEFCFNEVQLRFNCVWAFVLVSLPRNIMLLLLLIIIITVIITIIISNHRSANCEQRHELSFLLTPLKPQGR